MPMTALEQANLHLAITVDIGRAEGKRTSLPDSWARESRLLIKDLNLKLSTDKLSTNKQSLPGANGPNPGSSSGGRSVAIVEPFPNFVDHGGSKIVDFESGAWEFVWRQEAAAGQLIFGFDVPECVRNDAVLPKGRIYIAHACWKWAILRERQKWRQNAEKKAAEAISAKEEALSQMLASDNFLMKALKFRDACAAMEQHDYSSISTLKSVPYDEDVLELKGGIALCKTGTIWCKNKQLIGPTHVLLGHTNTKEFMH